VALIRHAPGRDGRKLVLRAPAEPSHESGSARASGVGALVAASRTSSQTSRSTASTTEVMQRTYVVDTSVLLSDPRAMFRFAEHAVVLPVVVITELEAKRHDPEIGYFARQALRHLDELRVQHERLDFPIAVGEQGGSLRVELNHSNQSVLPSGLQLGDNDSRILAVALNLAQDMEKRKNPKLTIQSLFIDKLNALLEFTEIIFPSNKIKFQNRKTKKRQSSHNSFVH